MKIKCISTRYYSDIALGRAYDVIDQDIRGYRIINDAAVEGVYNKIYFSEIIEQPAPQAPDSYKIVEYALGVLASYGLTHHTSDQAGDLHYDSTEVLNINFPNHHRRIQLEETIATAQKELDGL
jgi:hypothetical protein